MRRKLFCCAIAMIIGIVLINIDIRPAVIFALVFLWNVIFKNRLIVLLTLFLLLGSMCSIAVEHRIENNPMNTYEGKNHLYSGKIVGIEQLDKSYYQIVCEIDDNHILVSYYHSLADYPKLMGCVIEFSTVLEKPKASSNPRTFDYAQYLKSREIYHIGIIDSFQIASQSKSVYEKFKSFVLSKREAFFLGIDSSKESIAFLKGVLFGDTHQMREDVNEEFRINGTAHVLAVSGLHVGMLYSVYKLLTKKKRSNKLTGIFIFMLFIYGTVSLWSISVTRAIILVLLTFLGQMSHRRYDIVTALASAAIIILIQNPFMIINPGFQMSFLAVLSIGFIQPFIARKINRINSTLSMALSVQIGLLPYIGYNFNYVSLISILCNFPIVFLISMLVPVGIFGFSIFLLSGIQIPLLHALLNNLAELVIKINHILAADGLFAKDVASPPLWVICLIYGLIFLITSEFFAVYWNRKAYEKFIPLLTILVIVVVLISQWEKTPFDQADLIFLDVGQGDCIQIKGEKNILIDGGGNIRYDIGKKTLKPYLLKNGINHLDLAAATHLHTDHYLGLEQLGKCFPIKQTLTKGKAGQSIKVSKGLRIDILWPAEINPHTEDENFNSLIFKVHQGGVTTLITGDITEEGEKALLQYYKGTQALKSDILKVAHHGSKYSSCEEFINQVNPEIAVISVGKNNYGHPNNDVIELLHKKGIMVYRTDISGAVGIINRKGKVSVCTKNQ